MTLAERVGGRCVAALVVKMSDGKNRERERASALIGCHLVERCNNQHIIDISGGGCIKEEAQPGQNVQGDAVSLFWPTNASTEIDEKQNTSWT